MVSVSKKTWLVTGANSGLGLCITLSALRAGHVVIATARDISKAAQDNPRGRGTRRQMAEPRRQVRGNGAARAGRDQGPGGWEAGCRGEQRR